MKTKNLHKTRSFSKKSNIDFSMQTDIESSCYIATPKKVIQRKRKKINKNKQNNLKEQVKPILHQRIYRFPLKRSKKTMRIYCYKQSDLGWPKKFTKNLRAQQMDNDVQSDSELVDCQVQRCKNNLLAQIASYRINNNLAQASLK